MSITVTVGAGEKSLLFFLIFHLKKKSCLHNVLNICVSSVSSYIQVFDVHLGFVQCYGVKMFIQHCFPETIEGYSFVFLLKKMPIRLEVNIPDTKIHGANMGPTWVLSAPDGPHVGPMNLAVRDIHDITMISIGNMPGVGFSVQMSVMWTDLIWDYLLMTKW